MEYMVVSWFITRLDTNRVYTWYTPSTAEGANLYVTAPETTGGTWSPKKRPTVSSQCQGQRGEAALQGEGSWEPWVTAGPAGQGLTDKGAEQICWWQPRPARSPDGQTSPWVWGRSKVNPATGQDPDQQAWAWLQRSCNGAWAGNKGESLSLKTAPGRRSSRPLLRFLLALSVKATSYSTSKLALSPGSHTPGRGDAHTQDPHTPAVYTVSTLRFFPCFCPAFVYHRSLSNLFPYSFNPHFADKHLNNFFFLHWIPRPFFSSFF